jgi:phosphoribosyl-ATP pyrophosphohydrolase/phosphoribosyl-AMP cyclohydrolase
MSLSDLEYDENGLVPVIAQDAETGEVRMVAWANREAIQRTLDSGKAHFFSRSRQSLWLKGETSGNTLGVQSVWVDCDGDTLLYLVDPAGPSCHTGADTCFFRRLDGSGAMIDQPGDAAPTLLRLERTLEARQSSDAEKSYTKSLLDKGAAKVDEKLREEAEELGEALMNESDDRVASESADLTYHLLVGLILRKVPLRAVLSVLSKRFGTSGHEEKASR